MKKLYLSGVKENKEKFQYYANFFKDEYNVINPIEFIYPDKKRLFKRLLTELMDCDSIFIMDNNHQDDDEFITEVNIGYNFDLEPIFEDNLSKKEKYKI